MTFRKILIANRGEIAVRIMRTARALGYQTVAVFSDADAGAAHVRLADEAVHLGGSAAAQSYLNQARILQAARLTGAQAVHPGYGFLAESAPFARACGAAGLIFVGPPADAIEAMGDKARAKARMEAAGVPTVPGYHGAEQDDARLQLEAERIGYPLLVKAVAGGGGRGMRLVHEAAALADALLSARREAERAFGDGRLMLERFVAAARHIEIQVFADQHGRAIHLAERDCTAQRRRQKVIEEAPSPVVSAELRERMGADAVRAAKAIDYVGAGTVELIVDEALDYCFLEMNTRLQVEHPVTEMVAGLDLVQWQLRIAAGEPLPMAQQQLRLDGHAIEARLYAEDPYAGFAPQTGRVQWFRPQALADRAGVRVDAGIVEGDDISPHYDPMIAKVIAHGRDRADAIFRLAGALEALALVGPRSNRTYLVNLLRSPAFRQHTLDTATLDRWAAEGAALNCAPEPSERAWALAALLFARAGRDWFRSSSPVRFELTLEHRATADAQPEWRTVLVERPGHGPWTLTAAGSSCTLALLGDEPGEVRYREGDVIRRAFALRLGQAGAGPATAEDGAALYLDVGAGMHVFAEASAYPAAAERAGLGAVVSPVAGTVLQVRVAVGDSVAEGDVVAVVEAMKMETRLLAERAGVVGSVHVEQGVQVQAGAVVVELAPAAPDPGPTQQEGEA